MKTFTPAVDNLLRGKCMGLAFLAEITLPGAATTYLWNGLGTLTYNGNAYAGLGKLGKIVGAGETAELRTTETSYQLSGVVDTAALNVFLSTPVRNGIARALVAFLDVNGNVIANPILVDQTILDTASMSIADDGTATLMLRGTSAVFDFRKPRGRYVTNEQLQYDFPCDTGFDRIPALANRSISWTKT